MRHSLSLKRFTIQVNEEKTADQGRGPVTRPMNNPEQHRPLEIKCEPQCKMCTSYIFE